MSGVKRMCKIGAKMALSIVVSVGLIGFVKGLLIGYYIGIHKAKSSWQHKM
jgi:ABC-type dipeptide/oligopeptide/nickel transport system permease subunit